MSDTLSKLFDNQGKEISTEELVTAFKVPVMTSNEVTLKPNWHTIPYSRCKKEKILPLYIKHGFCHVATSNPFRLELEQELAYIFDVPIEFYYCEELELLEWIDQYFHHKEDLPSQILEDLTPKQSQDFQFDNYDLLNSDVESSPSIRLLNTVIKEAITQNASDIHLEPSDHGVRIRYRIDGVLQNRHTLPASVSAHVTSRLKVLAELDIAEMRRPQDGRIKLNLGTKEIDFRISTIPIASGERIVLRILDKNNLVLGFDKLGMSPTTIRGFDKMIRRSEGIVLVTGPTGSGKTTTLYSAISEIYNESLNIMTIEDPIEYKLPGIAQINVRPKIDLTFSKGLRHILRQDPDVILIGEIRDLETAQIAIQASLTGHLVLSTLHTNDAPSAITRLVDMGIEPYLLASCIVGVIAQRLPRTLCPHCTVQDDPSKEQLSALQLQDEDFPFFKGKGCLYCYQTGYAGRHGIYELMPIQGKTKASITHSSDSSVIKKSALEDGLITLKEQGRDLIREGKTSVAEILRVAQGMEDQ